MSAASTAHLLYPRTESNRITVQAAVGERFGHLFDENDVLQNGSNFHSKVFSVDEFILYNYLKSAEGLSHSDNILTNNSSDSLSAIHLAMMRSQSVCVWKAINRPEIRYLNDFGIVGRSANMIALSFLSNIGGNPFSVLDDPLDITNILRSMTKLVFSSISLLSALTDHLPWKNKTKQNEKKVLKDAETDQHIKSEKQDKIFSNSLPKPLPRGRRFLCYSSRLNTMCWHPEKMILADASFIDTSVALHFIANPSSSRLGDIWNNPSPAGVGQSLSLILFPDTPSDSTLIASADDDDSQTGEGTETNNGRHYDSKSRMTLNPRNMDIQDKPPTLVNRDTFGGIKRMVRNSIGFFLPDFNSTKKPKFNSLDRKAFDAIDVVLSSDDYCRRVIGVQALAFMPLYMDTVLAVGMSNGFEVWTRNEDGQKPVTENWECLFAHTKAMRNQRYTASTTSSFSGTLRCCYEGVMAVEWSSDSRTLFVASKTEISLWPLYILHPRNVYSCLSDSGPPHWLEPKRLHPSCMTGLSAYPQPQIIDMKLSWCRPLLAILTSHGSIEIFDLTSWESRVWILPIDRKTPIVPRLVWNFFAPNLLCATESHIYQINFPSHLGNVMPSERTSSSSQSSPLRGLPSNPQARDMNMNSQNVKPDLNVPRGTSNRHSSSVPSTWFKDSDLDSMSAPNVIMTKVGDNKSDKSCAFDEVTFEDPVKEDMFELAIHTDDRGSTAIRSFAMSQSAFQRMCICFENDPYVYVYSYIPTDHQPHIHLSGRLCAPNNLSLFPVAMEFTRGVSDHILRPVNGKQSTSFLVPTPNEDEKPDTILSVKWAIVLGNDEMSSDDMIQSPDDIPNFLNLRRFLARRKRLHWHASDRIRNIPSRDNYRNPVWPVMIVTYPFLA